MYPELAYFRAVEVQKRGALHLHILTWFPAAPSPTQLQSFALAAGFGCSMDWSPADPGSKRFAYYVSKYATKSCDERNDVPWVAPVLDKHTGELRPMMTTATYRTWSSSRNWGLTIKECRAEIRTMVIAKADHATRLRTVAPAVAQRDLAPLGAASSGPSPEP
jgi:hypothetical protein